VSGAQPQTEEWHQCLQYGRTGRQMDPGSHWGWTSLEPWHEKILSPKAWHRRKLVGTLGICRGHSGTPAVPAPAAGVFPAQAADLWVRSFQKTQPCHNWWQLYDGPWTRATWQSTSQTPDSQNAERPRVIVAASGHWDLEGFVVQQEITQSPYQISLP
jgi:hypothetical protein